MVADEWEPVRGGTLGDAFEVIYGDQVELSSGVRVPAVPPPATFRHKRSGLSVTLHIDTDDGRPRVVRVELDVGQDDGRGIDRDRLRSVPLADLMRRALAGWAWAEHPEHGWGHGTKDGWSTTEVAADKLQPPGRALTDDDLAAVARVYLEHDGSAPVQAVATHFQLTQSGAAKRVMKARRAGLLPATSKGKATNREDDR